MISININPGGKYLNNRELNASSMASRCKVGGTAEDWLDPMYRHLKLDSVYSMYRHLISDSVNSILGLHVVNKALAAQTDQTMKPNLANTLHSIIPLWL